MIPIQIKEKLMENAKKRHNKIIPVTKKGGPFTEEKDRYILWFDTIDNSTHIEFLKKI